MTLASSEPFAGTRTRRPGGGRKRATDSDATLLRDLDALVEPTARGDPDSPLRWTCLSARTLAVAREALGHHVSHTVVAELLHGLIPKLGVPVGVLAALASLDVALQNVAVHD